MNQVIEENEKMDVRITFQILKVELSFSLDD